MGVVLIAFCAASCIRRVSGDRPPNQSRRLWFIEAVSNMHLWCARTRAAAQSDDEKAGERFAELLVEVLTFREPERDAGRTSDRVSFYPPEETDSSQCIAIWLLRDEPVHQNRQRNPRRAGENRGSVIRTLFFPATLCRAYHGSRALACYHMFARRIRFKSLVSRLARLYEG